MKINREFSEFDLKKLELMEKMLTIVNKEFPYFFNKYINEQHFYFILKSCQDKIYMANDLYNQSLKTKNVIGYNFHWIIRSILSDFDCIYSYKYIYNYQANTVDNLSFLIFQIDSLNDEFKKMLV